MNEHRRQILQMLSEGKISADEAERLISALEERPSGFTCAGRFRLGNKGPAQISSGAGGRGR